MNILPSRCPKSGPARIQTFSLQGAVRYAFSISADNTSRLFSAVMVRHILTESRATAVLYVIEVGVEVLWPSATYHAFRRKFSLNLTSNIKCPVIC